MNKLRLRFFTKPGLVVAALLSLFISSASAQRSPSQAAGSRYDVTAYRIEAQLLPAEHLLRASADVTFTPTEATRSVIFELNGSLKVEGIE
nr:hypothetical protein [Acidobacteriota bacterium]